MEMLDDIDSIRSQLWSKMRSKTYRRNFVAAHLSTNVAAQIQTLREQREWKQKDLAHEAGMAPARISVLEDPAYDKANISTLKRLADAFDVALIVRFVPFSQLVDWMADLSPEKLEAVEFEKDTLARATSNLDSVASVLRGRPQAEPDQPRNEWLLPLRPRNPVEHGGGSPHNFDFGSIRNVATPQQNNNLAPEN